MAGGGNVSGGSSGGGGTLPDTRAPNPFQYSPQGNPTGMYGSQGNISGSDMGNLIQRNMGNYGYTVNALNQAGIGQPDVATMAGIQPENVYTYMNRPSPYTSQFYQPIYQQQYQSYSASPQATFGVAAYGTNPMMQQDIFSRGMQTVPYYGYGGGNLDMFGIPSVRTPFTYYPQQTGLSQRYSLDQRRTINPPTDDRRVVFGDGGADMGIGDFMRGQFRGPTSKSQAEILGAFADTTGGAYMSPTSGGGGGFGGGFFDPGMLTMDRIPDVPVSNQNRELQMRQMENAAMSSFNQPQMQSMARAPIVSRSAQARGTPNVMMRRAEGGITDLLKK